MQTVPMIQIWQGFTEKEWNEKINTLLAERDRLQEFAEMFYEWQTGHGSIAAMADHEVFKKMKETHKNETIIQR